MSNTQIKAKANTKARQVRELIKNSRTKDPIKLTDKVIASSIDLTPALAKRYVVNNLPKVLEEAANEAAAKKAAPKKVAAKKATARKPAAKKATAKKATVKKSAKKAA